jgi:hypothetical protein
MVEKIYVKGFIGFPKHEKAPEFVIGSLVININEFKEFVNGDGKQYLTDYKGNNQLKIQVTKGRNGGMVFCVDTYKPKNG